jgi:hypothetical protein
MPDVLAVATREISDPVALIITVVATNGSLHEFSVMTASAIDVVLRPSGVVARRHCRILHLADFESP